MPATDVAIVERCIEAIGRADTATLVASSAEHVEVRPLRAVLEGTVYRGAEGIEQWMRDLRESWNELRLEIEEIHEPAAGSIVAFVTLHARGQGSDAPVQMPLALTARLRDGLVTQAAVELDREVALREAATSS